MVRRIVSIVTATLFIIAFPSPLQAQGVINIRLSYKVILNPADGTRPIRTGATQVTDADINTAVNAMNVLLQTYFRGYRVQLVGSITNIGGMGDTTGPSRWFNTDFFNASNATTLRNQMEAAAMSDARYAWTANAINIYVNNGTAGGLCSFPGQGNIIIIGGSVANAGATQLHEIGHYFGLCHTQGCTCACGSCGSCGVAGGCTSPGDDGMADTLPDLACWSRDQIAQNSFGVPFASLSPAQQTQVNDTFRNLMSYHGTCCSVGGAQVQLTELQLDRWADVASSNTGGRLGVCDGVTIFVQANAPAQGGFRGPSTNPWPTIREAQDDAANYLGDLQLRPILILRPGAYNERLTLNTPMTLRTTRNGAATIGSSTPMDVPVGLSLEEVEKTLRRTPGVYPKEPVRLGFPAPDRKPQ